MENLYWYQNKNIQLNSSLQLCVQVRDIDLRDVITNQTVFELHPFIGDDSDSKCCLGKFQEIKSFD